MRNNVSEWSFLGSVLSIFVSFSSSSVGILKGTSIAIRCFIFPNWNKYGCGWVGQPSVGLKKYWKSFLNIFFCGRKVTELHKIWSWQERASTANHNTQSRSLSRSCSVARDRRPLPFLCSAGEKAERWSNLLSSKALSKVLFPTMLADAALASISTDFDQGRGQDAPFQQLQFISKT